MYILFFVFDISTLLGDLLKSLLGTAVCQNDRYYEFRSWLVLMLEYGVPAPFNFSMF